LGGFSQTPNLIGEKQFAFFLLWCPGLRFFSPIYITFIRLCEFCCWGGYPYFFPGGDTIFFLIFGGGPHIPVIFEKKKKTLIKIFFSFSIFL